MTTDANSQRITMIRERLTTALSPALLDIIDDSHKHVGHAGARSGGGHFVVRLCLPHLSAKDCCNGTAWSMKRWGMPCTKKYMH